jgi:ApeA N-terminal domain 1
MIFEYAEIQSSLERFINNWLKAYSEINATINLYFSTKTGANSYFDSRFLALVQALETYHRRTTNETLMPKSVFDKLVDLIISNCPDDNREWLEGRLRHGNEVSLRKRITKIIEPFKKALGNTKERSKIISSIVDTRNYLTHYDKSLESIAARGNDLMRLCDIMEAILQLHFLWIIGFTQEEIECVLKRSHELKRKLK